MVKNTIVPTVRQGSTPQAAARFYAETFPESAVGRRPPCT